MKRFPIYMIIACMMLACGSKKPKEQVSIESPDGKEKVSVDVSQGQKSAEDLQKQAEELQKLPVLTLEQLKALLPSEIMGVKQSNYSATSMSGASYAKADYRTNDSTNVGLMVYDCAGTAGAGIYSAQYMTMLNIQQEDENGYTKTVEFNGQKAMEHCTTHSNECSLTYFTGGRFLVTLQGDHVDASSLKDIAKGLSLK